MNDEKLSERCYAVWAPAGSAWSAWAKPALFVHLGKCRADADTLGDWRAVDVRWAPDTRRQTAILVELPAATAVRVGLALAAIGYRPVPLYNVTVGAKPLIDVGPIGDCLIEATPILGEQRIADDAPPAFLLDSRRMTPHLPSAPGHFDNRWIVTPQDFPSANLMLSRGISEVLLVRDEDGAVREDLAHVLPRWQSAGIRVRGVNVTRAGAEPAELVVRKPTGFRRAWYRVLAFAGLRRNAAGGFGAIIPHPSSGAG